jgi:hypothetical protein
LSTRVPTSPSKLSPLTASFDEDGQKLTTTRNFLYSKKFFWFGAEPVDTKSISTFKADKAADVAHHVHAWAAETGKGLLFFSEKADKATPHGAIQLVRTLVSAKVLLKFIKLT